MLKSYSRRCTAWIGALICAGLLAGPVVAGPSGATQEAASAGRLAQVTPVVLDPSSGRQIAVWSVFDGITNKIAYAQLDGGVWSNYHYLTFGSGNHTSPRIGFTREGTYLFWIVDGRRYLYAPLDLSSGRLHASPRHVPIEMAGLRVLASGSARGTATEGGSDVPIVTEECPPNEPDCEVPGSNQVDPRHQILPEGGSDVPIVTECPPDDPTCESLRATTNDRRRQILGEGGSDVPIVTECPPDDPSCEILNGRRNDPRTPILTEGGSDIPVVAEAESFWTVISRPGCSLIILSVPAAESGAYHLLKFGQGRIESVGRIRTQPGSTEGLPAFTAAPVLDSSCF